MKHIFIINPTAGKYDSRQRIYEMAEHLRTAHGLDVQCILTKKQGHATEIAQKLCQTGDSVLFPSYASDEEGSEGKRSTRAFFSMVKSAPEALSSVPDTLLHLIHM